MDEPIQLSIPLPLSLDTRVHLHLTIKAKAIMLFMTTASADEAGAATPLGSFVYAIPDVCPGSSLLLVGFGPVTKSSQRSEIQPRPAAVNATLYR